MHSKNKFSNGSRKNRRKITHNGSSGRSLARISLHQFFRKNFQLTPIKLCATWALLSTTRKHSSALNAPTRRLLSRRAISFSPSFNRGVLKVDIRSYTRMGVIKKGISKMIEGWASVGIYGMMGLSMRETGLTLRGTVSAS